MSSTLTIPTSASELEELLADHTRLEPIIAAGQLGEVVTAYARTTYQNDMDIKRQVQEQTAAALAELLKNADAELDVKRPNLTAPQVASQFRPGNARNIAVHNPKAMGASIDKDFDNSADYFRTIWHNASNTADRQTRLSRIRNAFSSTVPSEGGFLIPETLRSELLMVALENSVVRSRARVIPMETLRVPFPAIDSTSNASSVFGGVVAYWTEEGAALTAAVALCALVVATVLGMLGALAKLSERRWLARCQGRSRFCRRYRCAHQCRRCWSGTRTCARQARRIQARSYASTLIAARTSRCRLAVVRLVWIQRRQCSRRQRHGCTCTYQHAGSDCGSSCGLVDCREDS